jgi:SPP1 family phage portal protein
MRRIEEIMTIGDASVIYTLLTSSKKPFRKSIEITESEYNPERHAVMDSTKRKKKAVKVKTDAKDSNGNTIYKTKFVDRCRIAIPAQKLICERDVGFLLAEPVKYNITSVADEQQLKLYEGIENVLQENKIDYFDKRLARELFRARECAELWYIAKNGEENEMRVMLLSPLRGDILYPHFDNYHRMDGFARRYNVYDELGNLTIHFDVYTSTMVYRYVNDGSVLTQLEVKPHGFAKIPVVYYRQEETNWDSVQPVIDRLEELLSNWGDVNDYFGAPTYFFKGKMKGFADKGEAGRVYQGEGDSDMRVVSWNSAPESMKQEVANLTNIIFSYSQTPDISFENMKTLGNNTSGAAIRLMFSDPHLKAKTKEELFGEMFTRRYNVVKSGYSTSIAPTPQRIADGLHVNPVFTPYIPKNESELLQLINLSTQGKETMSQEDGVRLNPLVSNPEVTLKELQKQSRQDAQLSLFASSAPTDETGTEE